MKSPAPAAADSPLVRALRLALRNESEGLVFYRLAASGAPDDASRRLFAFLAEEEERHYRTIREQIDRAAKGRAVRVDRPAASKRALGRFRSPLFTEELLEGAGKAKGAAAALSVGMTLERKAIRQFLALRKKAEGDTEAEEAFDALVAWEREHLGLLSAHYGALREEAWEEAGFWPF